MTEQKQSKQKEVVLYHGSLEELNSRDPNRQYRLSETPSFLSNFYSIYNDWEETIKRELKEEGFDGLVNCRSIFGKPGSALSASAVEGTPIVRIKKDFEIVPTLG